MSPTKRIFPIRLEDLTQEEDESDLLGSSVVREFKKKDDERFKFFPDRSEKKWSEDPWVIIFMGIISLLIYVGINFIFMFVVWLFSK